MVRGNPEEHGGGPPDPPLAAQPGAFPGLDLDASAQLGLSLGKVVTALQAQEDRRQAMLRALHQVPIAAPQMFSAAQAGAAGTIDVPDLLGPHPGYWWDIKMLAAMSFTGGTVTCYRNYAGDENVLMIWTQAGVVTLGGQAIFLAPRDRLVFTGTSITGNVTISGTAIQVESWLVPDYLL